MLDFHEDFQPIIGITVPVMCTGKVYRYGFRMHKMQGGPHPWCNLLIRDAILPATRRALVLMRIIPPGPAHRPPSKQTR